MKRSTRLQRPGLLGGSTATTLLDADGPQPSLNLDLASGILDPRITFTRSTVGTYYRGQFNQNLVLQSEAFDTWLKNTAGDTVTVNAGTAPNGTTTADKIIPDATSGAHGVYRGTSVTGSTTYTQSVYVKADGFSWFYFTEGGWLTATAWFNVAVGTVGTVQGTGSPSATITAVGNGWYRCTMTFTTLSTQTTANFQVRPTTGNNIFTGYAGNGVDGLLAWGAQQTEGSLLTPYIPTTTAAITQGQIASSQPWNLVTQSETFSTWTALAMTVANSAMPSPTGVGTAYGITEDGTTNQRALVFNVTSGLTPSQPATQTVYVKAGARNRVRLVQNAASGFAEFLLTGNGSVLSNSGISASIDHVGNGWYRCRMTANCAASGTLYSHYINPQNSSGSNAYAGDGQIGIYVWGAQLNEGTSALDYNPTTTVANWLPRFENDPVTGEARGLLIEGGATNLCLRSAEFNTTWTAGNTTVTANAITAPDGTVSADKLIANTTNGGHTIYQGIAVTSGTAYTHSVFAKAAEYTKIQMVPQGTATLALVEFDLSAGTSTLISGTATHSINAIGNGWYRCIATTTATATGTGYIQVNLLDGAGNSTFAGNNVNGVYLWGAQAEAQAFASSYIPTVAATVARGADSAVMTGTNFSSWYNQTEGTIYADQVVTSTGGSNQAAATLQQSPTQYLTIGQNAAGFGGSSSAFYIRDTTDQAVLNSSLTIALGSIIKSCGAYKVNDIAFSTNGLATITDTSSTVPTPTELQLFNVGTVASSRSIRRIAYWPTRLPNATLQSLTT